MHEIELKYQVPARRRAAVARAVAGRPIRLQAAYVDTPDRSLATAGLALRMRREGRAWVQTLKGEASDGMTRLEHNVTLPGRGEAMPEVDPARHAGTPAGVLLDRALDAATQPRLMVLFRTDIQRHRRALDTPQGRVELAFDEGFIEAGGSRLPVCELEIELLSGSPAAVIGTARDWMARHGLWLDTRTKAERGDRLSRSGAAVTWPPDPLVEGGDLTAARHSALQACWRRIAAGASEVAAASGEPQALHELRVGLRRLRSLQRLLRDSRAEPSWAAGAAALLRALGAARDQEAMAAAVLPALQAAWKRAGAPDAFALPAPEEAPDAGAIVRGPAAQGFLLDLLQQVSATPAGATPPEAGLEKRVARRLGRWQRDVAEGIARFHHLDDAGRHRLRKRIKRLRYATEWAAPLYPHKAVQRYLVAVREAQACLGEMNDVAVAHRACAGAAPGAQAGLHAPLLFALGWLSARRDDLLQTAPARLAALKDARPYWQKKRKRR